MNLLEWLDNPNSEAARAVLSGVLAIISSPEPRTAGPVYQAWREKEQQRQQLLTEHWRLSNSGAERRDQAMVQLDQGGLCGGLFVAVFPGQRGDRNCLFRLAAKNVEECCQEVDRRWPMPDW